MTPKEEKRDGKARRLKNEWIRALRRETLRQEEAKTMKREWNELHGCLTTQRTRTGRPSEMIEEIRRESEARRQAFDEEAARLFPRSRQV
jgi:hypothetical protein